MIWLLKNWRLVAAGLAILVAIAAVLYYGAEQREAGEREVHAAWAKQRADQTAAALGSLRKAIETAEAERKEREHSKQLAADALAVDVKAIRARVGSINQKLEESRNADPACAAYLDSPIACPLPWRVPEPSHRADDHPGAGTDAVREGPRFVPLADLPRGAGDDDDWRPAPVHGRIARED